ncbi:MAG: UbiX family flavin prenyltransferase [Actinobacteria bacterium]|nr:MAG: UbiX family flavin prenyltransferase [Actinomycetota bacterium]
MRIFLGITGASGAPYAARLLEGLVAAGCEVGVTASSSGVQVLGTELWAEPGIGRKEALARLVGDAPDVTGERSHGVLDYVICPCSMATVGTIAAGAMANLVHRAASVALKEGRRLVLVPRETPLSTIHLENLLRLRQAGAVILFAAPGFYHAPETVDDLINFVVGRCLDQLSIEQDLVTRWGE